MLGLENITITQDDFTLHANLQIVPGARVAILGPSGAGKSTLLGAMAGFVPVQGRIKWQGQDIACQPPAARPLSILFQDNNLFAHLSAFDNVALGVKPNLRLSPDQRARVKDALAQVGLAGLEARKPAHLSGGQQSRVALARVLLQDRPLMLLDEPFSALGPALKAEMLALVAQICDRAGATLLMVTHDIADARAIASEVVIVADGQATGPLAAGPTLDDPPPALRAYIGAP